MVGTLKLDGTAQAVSKTQAESLLPLWSAYQSLASSSTASQAEIDALLTQIKSAMTSKQLKAITALGLTEGDIQGLFTSTGFNPTYEATRTSQPQTSDLMTPSTGNSSVGSSAGAPPAGGAPPSGDMGGRSDGPNAGSMMAGADAMGLASGTSATLSATPQAGSQNITSSPLIYNLIIHYLQQIISTGS